MVQKEISLSKQVKHIRMKLRLSQSELAKQMGVSVNTVSRWERENRTPQMATLGKLFDFCKKNGIDLETINPEQEKIYE